MADQREWMEAIEPLKEDGHSNREIARRLGCNEKWIRKCLKRNKIVELEGITPDDSVKDGASVIEELISKQGRREKKAEDRRHQKITINDDQAIGIALFSDLHFGATHCDYRGIKRDAEAVADTDGFYGIAAGDYHENWIGKLSWINADQDITLEKELSLVDWWFGELGEKLLVAVAGNHDTGRTKRLAGFDNIKMMLRGKHLLYDPDEVSFVLNHCGNKTRFVVRHNFPGRSQMHDSHGMVKWDKFNSKFDVAICGHTHTGTLFTEFFDPTEMKYKLGVRVGTYKFHDRYALQHGFPTKPPVPSGAIVFMPDGEMIPFKSIVRAAEYLNYLRA